jgi:hypothetical protein
MSANAGAIPPENSDQAVSESAGWASEVLGGLIGVGAVDGQGADGQAERVNMNVMHITACKTFTCLMCGQPLH